MNNDTSSGIFLVMLMFCFYLKETMEKQNFASFVQVFKLDKNSGLQKLLNLVS